MMSEVQSATHSDVLKLAKGAGVAGFGEVLFKVLTPILAIASTRVLGAEIFGTLTLVVTVVQIAMMLSLAGLHNGVLRYVAYYKSRNDLSRVKGTVVLSLGVTFGISSVIAIVLFFSSHLIAVSVYNDPNMVAPLQFFVVFLPVLVVARVLASCLQSFGLIRWQVSITKVIRPLLEVVLLLSLFVIGLGLKGAIAAKIIAAVVALSLSYSVFIRNSRVFRHTAVFETRELLAFSVPLFLESIMVVMLSQVNMLILGYLAESTVVGIYKILVVIATSITLPLLAFRVILAPMIADYDGRKDCEGLQKTFKLGARWTFWVGFPIFLVIILFPKQILMIFGAEFVIGVSGLVILCLGRLVDISVGAVGIVLRMTGHSKVVLINSVLLGVLSLVLSFVLVPRYGLVGAALASAFSVTLTNVIKLAQVYYFLKISPYDLKFLKPLLSGVLSFVSIRAVSQVWLINSFLEMFVLLAGFGILYIVILVGLRLGDEDKAILSTTWSRLKAWKNSP